MVAQFALEFWKSVFYLVSSKNFRAGSVSKCTEILYRPRRRDAASLRQGVTRSSCKAITAVLNAAVLCRVERQSHCCDDQRRASAEKRPKYFLSWFIAPSRASRSPQYCGRTMSMSQQRGNNKANDPNWRGAQGVSRSMPCKPTTPHAIARQLGIVGHPSSFRLSTGELRAEA